MLKYWEMYKFCEKFGCLPLPGGYRNQDPIDLEIFNTITKVIDEKKYMEYLKEKTRGEVRSLRGGRKR